MSTARQPYRDTFQSGESVPQSGLYRAEHVEAGCDQAQMVLIRSERFPECPVCGSNVRFTLVQAVPHIHEDPDFSKE